jgi:hypothetical protein
MRDLFLVSAVLSNQYKNIIFGAGCLRQPIQKMMAYF